VAALAQNEIWSRLKRFVRLWVDLFDRHQLLDHAGAISFAVLKSLIPLTLLGLGVLGALGEERVWRKTLAPRIEHHLQQPTFQAIDSGVQRLFSTSSTGLVVFAAFLSAWYISGAVRAAMGGIDQIYEAEETRPWWLRYPLSFALAAAIAVCVIGSILVVAALPALARHGATGVVVSIGRWLVAIALLGLAVWLLVRYAPAERRPKRWATAGSVLVIAGWIGATLVFKVFATDVANFKSATGGLAVFLVLIAYVYTSSIIFLVGVELDELFREDATAGEKGVLELLFGIGR
jgi:membrane protein